MKRGRSITTTLFSCGIACALAAFSAPAQAYCRSTTCDPAASDCPKDENGCARGGPPLSWRTLPLTYRFQRDGSSKLDMGTVRDVARAAFATWSHAECEDGRRTSLRFQEGADITRDKPLGRKQASEPFGIYFRDDTWPYPDGDDALAMTSQVFGLVNGYIDYSDIEINTTDRTYATDDDADGIDLQAVFTHEIGHYIGLAHSNVKNSIMVARYCESADRCGKDVARSRALAEDDIAAVCALYPPSGIAGVKYEAPSSCAASRAASPAGVDGTSGMIAIGAIAAALVARKRARG